jgi:hypothetical protein
VGARLAILELHATRGGSQARTADVLFVTPAAAAPEIRIIRTSYYHLARALSRIARPPGEPADVVIARDANGSRPRSEPRLTAQQGAALKLQDKYMGTMLAVRRRSSWPW